MYVCLNDVYVLRANQSKQFRKPYAEMFYMFVPFGLPC